MGLYLMRFQATLSPFLNSTQVLPHMHNLRRVVPGYNETEVWVDSKAKIQPPKLKHGTQENLRLTLLKTRQVTSKPPKLDYVFCCCEMAIAENKSLLKGIEGGKLLECITLHIWTVISQQVLINQVIYWLWEFPEWEWKIISAPKSINLKAFYSRRSKRWLHYQRTCDFRRQLIHCALNDLFVYCTPDCSPH